MVGKKEAHQPHPSAPTWVEVEKHPALRRVPVRSQSTLDALTLIKRVESSRRSLWLSIDKRQRNRERVRERERERERERGRQKGEEKRGNEREGDGGGWKGQRKRERKWFPIGRKLQEDLASCPRLQSCP
jgi:hypothetical protein